MVASLEAEALQEGQKEDCCESCYKKTPNGDQACLAIWEDPSVQSSISMKKQISRFLGPSLTYLDLEWRVRYEVSQDWILWYETKCGVPCTVCK